MTKIKSTKRALLMSALALVMCFSMLIGSTFAWFTDTASTGVNTIQSGTLKVDLEDAAGKSIVGDALSFVKAEGAPAGEAILWEPGCTYKLTPVYVNNEGTLALKYKVVINGLDGDAKLLEAIEWSVEVNGTTTDLAGFEETLNANEKSSNAIVLVGHMKEEAGNEYQDLTAEGISITVVATQATVEYDSEDNQYDAGAEYPVVVTNAAELADALTAGKNVVLAADISVASDATFASIPAGKSVTLDMAGHKLTAALGNQDQGVNVDTAVIKVENGATLMIDGDGEFYLAPNKSTAKASTIIANKGTTVIESGKFEVMSGTSYAGGYIVPTIIDNSAANTPNCSPTLIINGGTFTFDRNMIRNFPERLGGMTTITINGGTFTSTDDEATIWNQWGTQTGDIASQFLDKHQITINGGTFNNVVINDDFKDVEGANQVIVADGVNVTVK